MGHVRGSTAGTGIGLSIAKQLTKLLAATSEWKASGERKTFWFRVSGEVGGRRRIASVRCSELRDSGSFSPSDNARQRSILEKQLGSMGREDHEPRKMARCAEAAAKRLSFNNLTHWPSWDLQMAGMMASPGTPDHADPAMGSGCDLDLTADPKLLPSKVVTQANAASCRSLSAAPTS